MRARAWVRPSKATSAIGLIGGIVFVGIGIFALIPLMGPFGMLWTLAALGITIYNAFNLFSERGVAQEVVDFDSPTQQDSCCSASQSPEDRLLKLDGLKNKGLVSDEEYEEQRKRILNEI